MEGKQVKEEGVYMEGGEGIEGGKWERKRERRREGGEKREEGERKRKGEGGNSQEQQIHSWAQVRSHYNTVSDCWQNDSYCNCSQPPL